MRGRLLLVLLGTLVLCMLCSCSGPVAPGDGASTGDDEPEPAVGQVEVTVVWPPRVSDAEVRLIPVASGSVKIQALHPDTRQPLGNSPLILVRPESGGIPSKGVLDELPVGDVTFVVTAHPDAEATGVPQAHAELTRRIHRGLNTDIPIVMDSTITNVDITPDPLTVPLGGTYTPSAAAKDADGSIVPVSGAWEWAISNAAVATIDATTGEMTGVDGGVTSATVVEPESGVSGACSVGVPELVVSPSSLDFASSNTPRSIALTNSGGGDLAWTCSIAAGCPWLTTDVGQGTGEAVITLQVDRADLTPVEHTGTFSIASNGGPGVTVDVRLDVPQLAVSTTTLNYGTFDVAQPSKTFTISNTGTGTVEWTCASADAWAQLNVAAGQNSGTVTVTIDGPQLAPGAHNTTLTITSNAGSATVNVGVDMPGLSVAPGSLPFGTATPQMALTLQNVGTGTLTWSCTEAEDWITGLAPTSGSLVANETTTVTVDVYRLDLIPDDYSGEIAFTANGATQSLPVPVTITRNTGGVDVNID